MALEKAEDEDVQEYDFFDKLIEGNFCYTSHTRAYIESEEDIDE